MATKLEILGIKTVEDLLWYAPFRYNDYSIISPIARMQPGETVTVRGYVISMKNAFTKTGKKLQQAKIRDSSGTLDVIWFNQMYLTNIIKVGDTLSLSGKVDWFGRSIVMISPEYEIYKEQSLHTGRLVPVYSETEGLSSKWLRGRIAFVIESCLEKLEEYIPEFIRNENKLPDITHAISSVHFPKTNHEAELARQRLAFDELFLLIMRAKEQKRHWQMTKKSHPMNVNTSTVAEIISSLPFELTGDQKKAVNEILDDLKKPIPMNRLLEGDVGSGKTVVAAIAMYIVKKNGFQSLLMAPTEILATQHFETLSQFLSPLGISVGLITGAHKDKGAIDVYVGTHALLFQKYTSGRIALIVIDEQQRFGVAQRGLLAKKTSRGKNAHLLTMTATPIPRTVAHTMYGNLDLSILKEMPVGRLKVKTWVVDREKRTAAYAWIQKQIAEEHAQAFIVCPLIEESESMSTVKAVNKEYRRLKKDVFPRLRLGLLHGRMNSSKKSSVLTKFRDQKLDILVTTPVVEVGIDIPNATIMMIEAADRFGLSQLHQLRGRVGRRNKPSYCLLFTEKEQDTVITRLKAMERVYNGPELAELDLRLRGPGELFGNLQHGFTTLRVASFSDTELISQAKASAERLFALDPDLTAHPLLRGKLKSSIILPV